MNKWGGRAFRPSIFREFETEKDWVCIRRRYRSLQYLHDGELVAARKARIAVVAIMSPIAAAKLPRGRKVDSSRSAVTACSLSAFEQ